jgi:hypothetical protein
VLCISEKVTVAQSLKWLSRQEFFSVTSCWNPSNPVGYVGTSSQVWSAQCVKSITYLHLDAGYRMNGALPLCLLNTCMMCCLSLEAAWPVLWVSTVERLCCLAGGTFFLLLQQHKSIINHISDWFSIWCLVDNLVESCRLDIWRSPLLNFMFASHIGWITDYSTEMLPHPNSEDSKNLCVNCIKHSEIFGIV